MRVGRRVGGLGERSRPTSGRRACGPRARNRRIQDRRVEGPDGRVRRASGSDRAQQLHSRCGPSWGRPAPQESAAGRRRAATWSTVAETLVQQRRGAARRGRSPGRWGRARRGPRPSRRRRRGSSSIRRPARRAAPRRRTSRRRSAGARRSDPPPCAARSRRSSSRGAAEVVTRLDGRAATAAAETVRASASARATAPSHGVPVEQEGRRGTAGARRGAMRANGGCPRNRGRAPEGGSFWPRKGQRRVRPVVKFFYSQSSVHAMACARRTEPMGFSAFMSLRPSLQCNLG